MNKYEFASKQLILKTWKKEAQLARMNVIVAIKKLEVIENKIKELKADVEK